MSASRNAMRLTPLKWRLGVSPASSSTSMQALDRSLRSHSYSSLRRPVSKAASREVQRYASIHAFFTSHGIQQGHLASARVASFSTGRVTNNASEKPEQPQERHQDRKQTAPAPSSEDHAKAFENYPRSLRQLAMRAIQRSSAASSSDAPSSASHTDQHNHNSTSSTSYGLSRPSKEDLLRNAKGFWTRLRIRFKWFTIRGFRRFNADDFSAFFTLGGLGTIALIVVGTTTAVSVVLWGLDLLNMQKWIARKIADYLTSQTGVVVVFESAIVPKWKDSRICFQNVFITRRANGNDPESLRIEREKRRRSRSRREQQQSNSRRPPASTAGMGMAWEGVSFEEYADDDEVAPPLSSNATGENLSDAEKEVTNTNYTMFDLNVDSIDVTLSISRWFDGKGLIEDAVVKGVRGIIDRRNVFWNPDMPYDPRAARRALKPGDFELESLEVHDLLVTIYQPQSFRPFNFSIFDATVPKLRKQWLFYDLLSADSITGQVDGCLFSLHKPQSIGRTMSRQRELSKETGRWRTVSRLRIDGVNIDHIQNQSNLGGPLSWIISGRFDVVADIRFPRDSAEDVDINTIIAEIVENLATAVSGSGAEEESGKAAAGPDDVRPIPGQHELSGPAIQMPLTTVGPAAERAWRESVRATGLSQGTFEDVEGANEGLNDGAEGGENVKTRRLKRLRGLMRLKEKEHDTMSEGELERSMDGGGGEDDGASGTGSVVVQPQESKSAHGDSSAVSEEERLAEAIASSTTAPPPSVVIDLDVRFKDIKAAVPLFDSDLTYRHQAFVRPIVAFMNANRTLIPVHCRVVMDLSEFDGSMDLAQTGLLPLVSDRLYEAMANHVTSSHANSQRLKSVSIWSLKQTLHAVLRLAEQLRDTMSGGGGEVKVGAGAGAGTAGAGVAPSASPGADREDAHERNEDDQGDDGTGAVESERESIDAS